MHNETGQQDLAQNT